MKQLYRSYGESTEIFKELEKKYPKNFKLTSIGKTWENRDINLITISKDMVTITNDRNLKKTFEFEDWFTSDHKAYLVYYRKVIKKKPELIYLDFSENILSHLQFAFLIQNGCMATIITC